MSNNSKKQLLVISDVHSTSLWVTVGAQGVVFSNDHSKIIEIVSLIREKAEELKVALIGEEVYEKGYLILKALKDNDIPWIVLLDKSQDEKVGYQELEKLSEKAIGMSLATH